MNPDAHTLWRAPRWALAVLLACLGMLGPFSIDTYMPAFTGIARSIGATPVEMQQTLSAYLFGFAFMNLFHGALSDSFGRRPVVLWGMAVFTLASAGCALSQSIGALVFFRALQGMSAGAGIVVSRAVIRDMFPPAEAQRVMSQVTIYFGVAPAIAPMVGGLLFVHAGWHAIFWFLTARRRGAVDRQLQLLPETLHAHAAPAVQRAPPDARLLAAGREPALPACWRWPAACRSTACSCTCCRRRCSSASTCTSSRRSSSGSSCSTIAGIMGGAWCRGRLAGRIKPKHQIRHGFLIMLSVSLRQPGAQPAVRRRSAWWALLPIAHLRVRLGADGAGGHADGARPGARAARHGVVAAGLHRQHGQRPRGRRDRAAGDAFDAWRWRSTSLR